MRSVIDGARLRFLAVEALSGFETQDRNDATYGALLNLSNILLHVADDPIAVALVSRIETMIDGECRVGQLDSL